MPGSKRRALAKTGGPGTVGRSYTTPCLGVESEKPSEERRTVYSNRSFQISLGAYKRIKYTVYYTRIQCTVNYTRIKYTANYTRIQYTVNYTRLQ